MNVTGLFDWLRKLVFVKVVFGILLSIGIMVVVFAAPNYFSRFKKVEMHTPDGHSLVVESREDVPADKLRSSNTKDAPIHADENAQSKNGTLESPKSDFNVIDEKSKESYAISTYCSNLPNGFFEIHAPEVHEDKNGITVSFSLYAKTNFPINHYRIEESYPKECMKEMIGYFVKALKNSPIKGKPRIKEAIFEGGADAVNNRRAKVAKYNGDIENEKHISLPPSQVTVNGLNTGINIRNNQRIVNYELAFLRGYFIYNEVLDSARRNAQDDLYDALRSADISFIATESQHKGAEYRYASVKLVIELEPPEGFSEDKVKPTSIQAR